MTIGIHFVLVHGKHSTIPTLIAGIVESVQIRESGTAIAAANATMDLTVHVITAVVLATNIMRFMRPSSSLLVKRFYYILFPAGFQSSRNV